MEHIQEYLLKTKSAVQKIYEAYNSYYELMRIPERPLFILGENQILKRIKELIRNGKPKIKKF